MRRPARHALIAAAALALAPAGCGLPERYDAARDVHAFFEAVRTDDPAAFERYVDRPALRRSVKGELGRMGGGDFGSLLGELLTGRSGDKAADALITPEAFRFAWGRTGISTEHTPSTAELTFILKRLDDGRVCVPRGKRRDRCVLTFADEGGTWKLVAVEAGKMKLSG